MPDGDRIHKLPHRYTKVYKQICEGNFRSYDLAHEAASPLIADVREYGQGPIRILEKVANELKNVDAGPLFRSTVDWNDMQHKIQRVVRQAHGHKRGCQIANMACQEFIHDLQQADRTSNLDYKGLVNKYLKKIFEVNFEGCLPESDPHDNADHDTVLDRVESIRPFLDEIIEALATQITENNKVDGLRRPTHHIDSIGLHDNLLEQ